MGSRYGGLKQIDPVGPAGETIIDYSIFDALRAGFGKLVFVIRKDIEQQFRETVGARFEKRVAVEYVFQSLEDIPPRFTVPPGAPSRGERRRPFCWPPAPFMSPSPPSTPTISTAQRATALWRDISPPARRTTPWSAFILRNTLSDFGSVARGVCQVGDDGYLEHIVEMTKIERDGNGRPQHRCRRERDKALRRRAGFDEYVGIYAACLRSTARALREVS